MNYPRLVVTVAISLLLSVSPYDSLKAATAGINASETYQTLEGFGASMAFWYGELYDHPEKEDIYEYAFHELGLDILRLRNLYGKSARFDIYQEFADRIYTYSENDVIIFLSSWGPPGNLKSNNSPNNGGTLKKNTSGEYDYEGFAQYWYDSLIEFYDWGIYPDYISIQNEPGFEVEWESCKFESHETTSFAGYDQALAAVYDAIQDLDFIPKILAPEVLGIGYNLFPKYANAMNQDYVDAYAYHLYHGGDGNENPDSFITNLSSIANSYSDKPIFQTEYDYGGWFNTAWLMHNCLVYGNLSAYLYWTIMGTSDIDAAFIKMGHNHFTVTKNYWAFRQFSKFIHAEWQRVGAEIDNEGVKVSAYISPHDDMLTVVIINTGEEEEIEFNIQDFLVDGGEIIRTSETEDGTVISNDYDGSTTLVLPPHSITTVAFTGEKTGIKETADAHADELLLSRCYPNPFNAMTTIEFSIQEKSRIQLKIYDVSGRELQTLINRTMPAGKHRVNFNAKDLISGIYFYQIYAGPGHKETHKMILIK